ncbi:hypothetical protein PRNP1_012849 [Phytophthora ramorum]
MEVLVAEDDNLISLEEALAFIDTCEINEQSFADAVIGAGPLYNTSLEALRQVTPAELRTPKAAATPKLKKRAAPRHRKSSDRSSSPKKQRTRSAASSSTRLQQRKKAEIQALREQAQELETQVDLLKKSKFLPGNIVLEMDTELTSDDDGALVVKDPSQKPPGTWREMAIAQYKERLVSEKTNRRLKSILENQEKVNGALSGLLQKRSVLHGMDYVLSTLPGLEPPPASGDGADSSSADNNNAILKELEATVKRLYVESKSKFTRTNQCPAISCDMKIKHDARRGKLIEFVTTTPMSCSVGEANEILWKELTTFREYPDKVYKYMKGTKPNTHEKNFVLCLRSPSGVLELNGLQYMEKFEEVDRTVFVAAERMLLPTKGFKFRVECWMTVTPSTTDSSSSVVEIVVQLYIDRDDGLAASVQDISDAQNIVMGSLSNTFRKAFQAQQNALMEKAGRIKVPAPAPSIVA